MRIVISDENVIWRYDNPVFEPYKEAMLVVCTRGRKVTDKYECFMCPPVSLGLGWDSYNYENLQFRNLLSVADDLVQEFRWYDDIFFLT